MPKPLRQDWFTRLWHGVFGHTRAVGVHRWEDTAGRSVAPERYECECGAMLRDPGAMRFPRA